MVTITRIRPNFNLNKFDTEDKALEFLQKFGFEKIREQLDYTIWETTVKHKVRAYVYLDKGGNWIVARQRRKIQ